MNRSRGPALVVLALLLLLAGRMAEPFAREVWMRLNGAVEQHGTSQMSWGGKPALMLSVVGHRVTGSQSHGTDAAAYHVMLIFPADSVTAAQLVPVAEDHPHSLSEAWELWSGGRKTAQRFFVSDYDPLHKRVRIDGRGFALSKGNLFVVRYDEQGKQRVTQLPRTVRSRDPIDVSHVYQALVPGDPVIQDLFHYPPPPCPKRTVAAPTRAEA